MRELSESNLDAARAMFEQAVERDPNLADAWSGIAHICQRELVFENAENPDNVKAEFLDAARHAVSADDSNAAAHYALCYAYAWNERLVEAVAEGERAVDLNPIDPISYERLGTTLILAGRPEGGVAAIERSISLNPRQPRIHLYWAHLARGYLDAHCYEDAVTQARRVLERGVAFMGEHLTLASALGHLGRGEAARAVLDDLEEYRNLRLSKIVMRPWWRLYRDPGPNEHLIDGLRKAGLPE